MEESTARDDTALCFRVRKFPDFLTTSKRTVAAWIEQILEFPTKLEYLAYIESLKKGKPQKFKETSFEQLESGVVRITIRKQYNNNAFPDDEKEGEK